MAKFVMDLPVDHEEFGTGGPAGVHWSRAGGRSHQADPLPTETMQSDLREPGKSSGLGRLPIRVNHDPAIVAGVELAQLDEDDASVPAEGCVTAPRGVPDIETWRIVAGFVGKDALQHQKFLASTMDVAREPAIRRIPDQACRPGDLRPVTIQHPPLDTAVGGRAPGQGVRHGHGPLGEIGIDLHIRGVFCHPFGGQR